MSRNGSGTYTLPSGNPVVTGTTISSTTTNNTLSDIATALTNSLAANGETPVTADIPMNSKKLTGLAVATATGDALSQGHPLSNFRAYRSTDQTSGTTAIFATEVTDVGAGYNPSTGVYTVPVSGTYVISAIASLNNASGGNASRSLTLAGSTAGTIVDSWVVMGNGAQPQVALTAVAVLTAGETVSVTINTAFNASTVYLSGAAGTRQNVFSAIMIA